MIKIAFIFYTSLYLNNLIALCVKDKMKTNPLQRLQSIILSVWGERVAESEKNQIFLHNNEIKKELSPKKIKEEK